MGTRNTKSIHDNLSNEDNIILMRQLSEGRVLNRQIQTTKCRSVTCNRESCKTRRVQRPTQVVPDIKQATINVYSIQMHMKLEIQIQIASSSQSFQQISCPRSSMQRCSSSLGSCVADRRRKTSSGSTYAVDKD